MRARDTIRCCDARQVAWSTLHARDTLNAVHCMPGGTEREGRVSISIGLRADARNDDGAIGTDSTSVQLQ